MEADLISLELLKEEAVACRASALAALVTKQRPARAALDHGVVRVARAPVIHIECKHERNLNLAISSSLGPCVCVGVA